MATQFDPIAKDESLNTTEVTPRNIADVLAEGLSAVEQAIAGGSGSGGHVIEDTNGTTLAQRADLQFVGVYTEDDSANDRTKVNVVRTMTKAQMDALSAAEKVGFIRTSDEADNPYASTTESVTLTKQSSAIDATTLSAKSKAGNLHFFGYFHNNASIASGTTIYTFADHLPSAAQSILALSTSESVASVTIYEDGRVYVASTMPVGYWVLVGEIWE